MRLGINIDLTRSLGGRRGGGGLEDGTESRFGAGAVAVAVKSDDAGAVDEVDEVEGCHVVLARIGEGTTSATSIEEVEGCLGLGRGRMGVGAVPGGPEYTLVIFLVSFRAFS